MIGEPEREHIEARDVRPGLIPGAERPRGPQVPDHSQHQESPRLQQSRRNPMITEQSTGLLTPFRRSASDTPARLPRHLSCGKARPALSTAAANCRKVQHSADDLDARLAKHAAGQGARLMAVVKEAGIEWELARTWPGGRARERQLKRQGGAARMCPLCGIKPRTPEADREAEAG